MTDHSRTGYSCALAALLFSVLLPGAAATAQTDSDEGDDQQVSRPQAASRIVRVFDFEEEETNPGQVPQHWYRDQDNPNAAAGGGTPGGARGADGLGAMGGGGRRRPGFPVWNKAALRYSKEEGHAFRGAGAVILPTQGGSTVLELGEGVLPVFDNADYLVTAMVKTVGLSHAKACITARFLDSAGKVIAGSESRSEMAGTGGAWQSIGIELVGNFADAAYMQLEMALLQPEQMAGGVAGRFAVWAQDYKGEAWFDDLSVMQLPRVELTTSAPANIVVAPEKPTLNMLVRDLTGESLTVGIVVVDHEGKQAAEFERAIGAGSTNTGWTPELKRLGWYRASMTISNSKGEAVGGAAVDFVWLPGAGERAGAVGGVPLARGVKGSADRARFGLVIDELPARLVGQVPEVVRRVGTGSVTLPMWSANLVEEAVAARTDAMLPVLGELLEDWQEVTLSLGRAPDPLCAATRLDADNPWALLLEDTKVWMPYAGPMLEKFGQRINRWQIGRAGDDHLFWRAGLAGEVDSIWTAFSAMVPGPVLVLPTRADREWAERAADPANPRAESVSFAPATMTPEGVRLAAAALAGPGAEGGAVCPRVTMVLEGHAPEMYGFGVGPGEVVKRAVEFWGAAPGCDGQVGLAPGIAIQQPWEWVGPRRPQVMPRPELAAWRGLIDRLSDRRIVGSLPVAEGVVCYILSPTGTAPAGRGGALVAWNNGADPAAAVLDANLGPGEIRVVDVFGNARVVPGTGTGSPAAAGAQNPRIALTQEPVFIEGIDVELVQFLASISIDEPFLEASNEQHEREIIVVNHWGGPVSGTITVLEPGGFETGRKDRTWRVSPRAVQFAAGAHETVRLPFEIAFSPGEEVGLKDFVMAVELSAAKQYGTLEVRRHVEVGVKDIQLNLSYSWKGEDLTIDAAIANTGQSSLTLELTAFAPGQARAKGSVVDLVPTNNTARQFRYSNAAGLRGQRVLVSVYDPAGRVRLNQSVLVE